jgi:prephenate dehydrogenase
MRTDKEGPIAIAGAGRMAQTLGRLLRERGEGAHRVIEAL